jgi:crossover junction endodeoxyribonuclease RusA
VAHYYDDAWLARHEARMAQDGGRIPVHDPQMALHSSLCQLDHPERARAEAWLTFTLPYPPSANHLYNPVAYGRTVLSAAGRDYQRMVGDIVLAQRPKPWTPLSGHLQVVLGFFPPDHRRRDIHDNPIKALADALTHAGVWVDDRHIDDCRALRGPVATPPYVVVWIRQVSPQHSQEVLMHL